MGLVYPAMNKKLLYIALLLLPAWSANSQSLEVILPQGPVQGVVGREIRLPLTVRNNTNHTVWLRLQEVDREIGTSQQLYYCYGNDCDRDNIALRQARPAAFVHRLAPGRQTDFFELVLDAGLVAGQSSATVRIENVRRPDEYVEFELQFEIAELPREGLLYFSKTVELSDVYPNPARDVAIFDYRIKDDSKEAKIIIHNVLGSVAGEYKLNPFENQLKISVEQFNPGVYFYSLYIDNEGVATKKLVVRK